MPSANNDPRDEQLPPQEKQIKQATQQASLAMELPFIFVGAIVFGGAIGFFLDRWLHTKPFLMLLFGVLGFVGGLRDVLRRLNR